MRLPLAIISLIEAINAELIRHSAPNTPTVPASVQIHSTRPMGRQRH